MTVDVEEKEFEQLVFEGFFARPWAFVKKPSNEPSLCINQVGYGSVICKFNKREVSRKLSALRRGDPATRREIEIR